MPEEHRVSVVIPVHNGANLIGRALTSVYMQSRAVDQIIVVDDGSTDDLNSALKVIEYQGDLIRQPQSGQGAALNAGISIARGNLIAFLDHDDEWAPKKTEQQLHALSPDVDAIIGSVVNRTQLAPNLHQDQDMGTARVLGASLIRSEAISRVGPFATDRRVHEIIDWWSRAHSHITTVHLDHPALIRHIHGGNQTLQPKHRNRKDLISRLRDHRKRIAAHD